MGTITGFTASRMQEIENSSIVDGSVVGDDLFLTQRDGTLINAGNVRGGPGPTGPSAIPPVVTALPATPVDGQEVYYLASAAQGVIWHLRYRLASPNPQKWEYVGGPPLRNEIATAQNTNVALAFRDLATVGPSLVVPLTGTYETVWGWAINLGVAGDQTVYCGPAVGAGVTPGGLYAFLAMEKVGQYISTTQRRRWAWTAGQEARLRYYLQVAVSTNISDRWLELTPVFVG